MEFTEQEQEQIGKAVYSLEKHHGLFKSISGHIIEWEQASKYVKVQAIQKGLAAIEVYRGLLTSP